MACTRNGCSLNRANRYGPSPRSGLAVYPPINSHSFQAPAGYGERPSHPIVPLSNPAWRYLLVEDKSLRLRVPTFTTAGTRVWIISHVARYKQFILAIVLATVVASVLSAAIPSLTGLAFNEVLRSQPDAGYLSDPGPGAGGRGAGAGGDGPGSALRRRVPGQALPARRARRAVRQPARQEPDLPQPPAGRRHHGARHQRCAPAQRT